MTTAQQTKGWDWKRENSILYSHALTFFHDEMGSNFVHENYLTSGWGIYLCMG
jgi:hypothetical protein